MKHADVIAALERDLSAIFSSRLRSLVTYGEATSGGPVKTLALVDSLTAADLRVCAGRVAGWQRVGLATPLLLAADEFARSLDAFPFEFGAILADHEVVSGANPFEGLAVDAADLRRACEVQARSHLLHLREEYMETLGRSDRIAELIARSGPALAALLRHVSRLTGRAVDAPVLARVAEIQPNGTISSDEADRIWPDYLQAMDQLVSRLDRWSAA